MLLTECLLLVLILLKFKKKYCVYISTVLQAINLEIFAFKVLNSMYWLRIFRNISSTFFETYVYKYLNTKIMKILVISLSCMLLSLRSALSLR